MKRIILVFVLSLIAINIKAQDLRTYPVLWHQTSAEYRALCYQAYNSGRTYLETLLKTRHTNEKFAIVTDLDETILDNSFLEAQGIKTGKAFDNASWEKWIDMSAATAIPGAVEFLQWAAKHNITIFYISNRTSANIKPTLVNLKKLELPYADEQHMMFLEDGATKEPRREKVSENFKIVMLLGDNLNDFTSLFENKNIADRKAEVDKVREEWGKRFIVIPNAIYGDWESAVYDYDKTLTPEQKDAKRKEKLTGL